MRLDAHLPSSRELLRLGPHADAHWVAMRAGLSVAAPLAILTATGHARWSVYAAFGAFASIYGRGEGYRGRARTQGAAAAMLVGAVTVGAAVSALVDGAAARWAVVLVSAALAITGSLAGDAVGWRPAGPMFAVFAVATCAAAPAVPSDIPLALGLAAASASFAVLVGLTGALSARRRGLDRSPSPPSGLRRLVDEPALLRHAARYGAATLVAGATVTVAGIGHPSWAMVAAVVPLSVSDTPGQLLRAGHRVIGTGVGLVVAAALLALDLSGGWLVLVIVLLQVATELVVVRHYGLAMLFITPLALLMTVLGSTSVTTGALLRDRALETVVGAVIGCGVALLTTRRAAPAAT